MSEEVVFSYDDIVKAAVDSAQNGSAILEELTPDLTWVNLRDLVGEKITVFRISDAQPGRGDEALRVSYADSNGHTFRFSTEHTVVIDQLRQLRPYLPFTITIAKTVGSKGMEYFHLA